METFYETENLRVLLHPEPFFELIIFENRQGTAEDLENVYSLMRERGIPSLRLLISRYYRYSPPPLYLMRDLSSHREIPLEKVAYFAPTPTSQILSHLVGHIVFRKIPWKVFSDRDNAVAWLLADEPGAAL